MSPLLAQVVGLAVISVLVLLFPRSCRNRGKTHLPLPPGPKRLPLIGNLLDVPKIRPWVTFAKWRRQYNSGILHFDICGSSTIVINSIDIARELLEKRSTIYSDRYPMIMMNDLIGFHWHFAFMPYGEDWKQRRKVLRQELRSTALLQHRPHQLSSACMLLRRLLEKPDEYMAHLRYMAGAFILSMTYGIQVQPENDPYIKIAETSLHAMACAGISGAYLVDSLPFLKHIPHWFPGAGFQVQAKEWKKSTTGMAEIPFEFVKESLSEGTAPLSIASKRLEAISEGDNKAAEEHIIRDASAAIYAGGSDTTVSALGSFFLAMVCNPEIQKKAQRAIDDVVGPGRLPSFTDVSSLPYIDAIVKEVNRWRPVVPLAVPRRVMKDDVFNSYRIPKNSIVVGNAWAMLYDEEVYPEPHIFRPERFLKNGKLDPDARDPSVAFGFGRRLCPGMDLANASMWITVALVLATFDIVKAVDKDGIVIEPEEEYSSGMLCYPKPFKCVIRPRSREAEALIRATASEGDQ